MRDGDDMAHSLSGVVCHFFQYYRSTSLPEEWHIVPDRCVDMRFTPHAFAPMHNFRLAHVLLRRRQRDFVCHVVVTVEQTSFRRSQDGFAKHMPRDSTLTETAQYGSQPDPSRRSLLSSWNRKRSFVLVILAHCLGRS